MKKLLNAVLIITIFQSCSYSLDTVSTKYYPLKVGNSWTYHYHRQSPPLDSFYKNTITSTVTANGHTYYTISTSSYRIDSTYGRLLKLASPGCGWLINEMLIDSLSSKMLDQFRGECVPNWPCYCVDTSTVSIFGLNKPSKTFNLMYNTTEDRQNKYAKDIGLYYSYFWSYPDIHYSELLGCVINGVVYGDTVLTGIRPISKNIPEEFSLFQNYPNPFNPATKIKFSILLLRGVNGEGGRGLSVKLTVYDMAGEELTILVNQPLFPGTYEVEFNGSNYPSGIYLYEMTTGGTYRDVKKMVLIK